MSDFVSEMLTTMSEETKDKFMAYMTVIQHVEFIIEEGDKHSKTCSNPVCGVDSKLPDVRKTREVLNGIVMAEMMSLAVDSPALMKALADDDAALANMVSQVAKAAGL